MTKPKPGRPPVKPELKARTRSIVLNDVQWNNLQQQAEKQKLSVKEYLVTQLHLNQKD